MFFHGMQIVFFCLIGAISQGIVADNFGAEAFALTPEGMAPARMPVQSNGPLRAVVAQKELRVRIRQCLCLLNDRLFVTAFAQERFQVLKTCQGFALVDTERVGAGHILAGQFLIDGFIMIETRAALRFRDSSDMQLPSVRSSRRSCLFPPPSGRQHSQLSLFQARQTEHEAPAGRSRNAGTSYGTRKFPSRAAHLMISEYRRFFQYCCSSFCLPTPLRLVIFSIVHRSSRLTHASDNLLSLP